MIQMLSFKWIFEISFNGSPAHHAFFWFLGNTAPLMPNLKQPKHDLKFASCYMEYGRRYGLCPIYLSNTMHT